MVPNHVRYQTALHLELMAEKEGFEPRTHALEGRCSIQLSYAPTLYGKFGAGEGDRTLTAGLEGRNSTIELHPHI